MQWRTRDRVFGLALVLLVTASCSAMPAPSPAIGSSVLSIDSRGGHNAVVVIGGSEITRVACDRGDVLRPGERGVPPLPWELRIRAVSDGRNLLAARVTELPQWVVIIGSEAMISRSPVAGPKGPACSQ